ncbi:uncharacterized protein LOC132581320 isoform X4 [Heteronotia binoei]|uniref:uncharacterized protein LOC132581320 isoform X4 n=1 Tax=Heteronotia binoei TaxID=13085 RepID=UPI00292D5E75|nr:uncharacterized protein LOC132581320 isoform X4 [Heteronotia binoei]
MPPEMMETSEAPSREPTASVPMDSNIAAIIIATTVSSSVFIVAILVLLLLLYHRDPLCCQFLCSCRFFQNPSQYGDELFCVGPPSSYQLPPWEQPRLPSYESVRKKDRQREIHQMIAERFGLWAEVSQELPPPYEQALRYPAALSGTGAGSELSARQSLPDMLQASPTFQPHRNTSV